MKVLIGRGFIPPIGSADSAPLQKNCKSVLSGVDNGLGYEKKKKTTTTTIDTTDACALGPAHSSARESHSLCHSLTHCRPPPPILAVYCIFSHSHHLPIFFLT
ncbi:unnamed protein product [Caenorhabditis auriculariae]|uniref:Uncharacterized protein n=1 Tax=Caenorhabditis auriculariae TaxID=2777116 RepID=A0A8S1HEZ9_9PELO|nr:unnamed protein product [Caenorhabditis auriculariae]